MSYKPLSYYLSLITHQYQMSPNFIAWLTAVLQMVDDVDTLIENMYLYFDIDNAVGAQLDILGVHLGQSRYLNFNPTDGSNPYLADELYRAILKFKIGVNSWDGQSKTIYKLWAQLFPNVAIKIVDNQDMSATITFNGSLPQIVIDMINKDQLIPRPEGVNYNFPGLAGQVVLPFFSYDMNDTYFTGYDYGYWDVSSAGTFGVNPNLIDAETDVTGTIITLSFDKVMADPTGKQSEFTINAGTSPSSHPTISSVRLNTYDNTKIDLLLASSPIPIYYGETVTLSYIGDIKSNDGFFLSAFTNIPVVLTMPQPVSPVLISASTSTDGTKVYLNFNKNMLDPTGTQAHFSVLSGTSPVTYDIVSSCSLTGSPASQITLNLQTPIVSGNNVTISYDGVGGVLSSDGGVLGIITAFAVTNNSLNPALLNAVTNSLGTKITLSFNKAMQNPSGQQAAFAVNTGSSPLGTVSSCSLDSNTTQIDLTLNNAVLQGQSVGLNYNPGSIKSVDGGSLISLSGFSVVNNAGAWSPANLPNLYGWFMADQISGNDGDLISTWQDQSGNGKDVTAAGSARPTLKKNILNSMAIVRFNGSSTFMAEYDTLFNSAVATIFMVVVNRAYNNQRYLFDGNNNLTANSLAIFEADAAGTIEIASNGINNLSSGAKAVIGTPTEIEAVFNTGQTYYVRCAGVETNSNMTPGNIPYGITIGSYRAGSYFSQIDVAEVIVYKDAKSASDRLAVRNYLKSKWGLSTV